MIPFLTSINIILEGTFVVSSDCNNNDNYNSHND